MGEPGRPTGDHSDRPGGRREPRGVNAVGVLLALAFLAVAVVGLSGGAWWSWAAPGPWIVAALAGLAGVALVVTAGGSRRRPGG